MNQDNLSINTSFKITEAPPRITMSNPDFTNLTAAEKLNDSEYRCLVYRTYPNEPTCRCTLKNVEHPSNPTLSINNYHNDSCINFPLKCPGGCMNSCCSTLRHTPIANNENNGTDGEMAKGSNEILGHCCGNHRTNGYCSDFCYSDQSTRYGNLLNEMNCTNLNTIQTQYEEHNSCCQYGLRNVSPSRFADHLSESHVIEIEELNYNSTHRHGCSGTTTLVNKAPESNQKSKPIKPQYEIDKFIRALEDAKKFVDSLGKISGVTGLGLIDPSERLYFRGYQQITDTQSPKIISKDNLMQSPMVNNQNNGPGNSNVTSQPSPSQWIKSTSFTIPVAGEGGIVREEILPMKHSEEFKQRIEIGPCGEVNCKSRPKKIINREGSMNKVENVEKSNQIIDNRNTHKKGKYDKYRRRRKRRKFGDYNDDDLSQLKKAQKANYVYLAGETYPGFVYGHKHCNERRKRIPPNMGWLWTQYQSVGRLKPRIGWRPGAISRQIREMLREAKAGLESRPSSVPSIGRQGRKFNTRSNISLKKGHIKKLEEENEELEPPPTLHIQRKNGDYNITMYPIREERIDMPNMEEPIKPLQFTLLKKLDDFSNVSSSTASDIDIEFSPPAAVNRYKKKPDVVHIETQVTPKDITDTFKPIKSQQIEKNIEKNMKTKRKKKSKRRKK